MREIAFFGEDHAHERIVGALICRLAQDRCMHIKMDKRSMRGGYGRVVREFTIYLHDLQRQQYPMPDLVVIATDTNCAGWQKRRQDIDNASNVAEINIPLVQALPDPHIERWLLLDGAAFKKVCGKGCQAPDQKCDRHRYKNLLIDAVMAAELQPLLGGIEFADDIMKEMNIQNAQKADPAFRRFTKDLDREFQKWQNPTPISWCGC